MNTQILPNWVGFFGRIRLVSNEWREPGVTEEDTQFKQVTIVIF
jgi:hypothetical protein